MAPIATVFERYREVIPDFDAFSEAVERDPPAHVRVNTLKTTVENVQRFLSGQGVETTSEPWCAELLRCAHDAERRLGSTLPHALGHFYMQSASSAVAALALGANPGDAVLDLCAAPGSKTTFLAQMLQGRGMLVANEPSRKRIQSLSANLRRIGALTAVVTTFPGQNFPKSIEFDRVLVDAPCSGEGTWVGADAKPQENSPDARARLAERQAAILERAVGVLKPGGTLIYSTCTYAPEENECIVADAVERHGLRVEAIELDLGATPGLTAWEGRAFPADLANTIRLYPHRFASEGFFVARLVKD